MPYSHPQPVDRREAYRKVRHLLPGAMAFAGTAGYVNSVGLGFFLTPVSHMTGAVSHLGIHLAKGLWVDAWASLSIILGFLFGAALAGVIVGAWQLVPNRRYGVALMAEGVLLALATLLLFTKQRLGLAAVAMACGLQNGTTSSYCGLIIRTTHVTGTMTDIGVMLGHWVRHRQIEWWKLRFLVSVVLAFGVGGWTGSLANFRFGPLCLAVAAAGCTVAGGVFWFITHRGLVDLMQDAVPQPPRTSSFPGR
ncbi:MAG TPA: YoaK family protein [Candidatus Limnocylindria bacterium]|nr:YoaK family protein [Candidatus Limnocylindria bacterium]